jgi:MFS family permease
VKEGETCAASPLIDQRRLRPGLVLFRRGSGSDTEAPLERGASLVSLSCEALVPSGRPPAPFCVGARFGRPVFWEVVRLASVERAASGSSGTVGAPSSPAAAPAGRRSLGATFRRLWWATGISASGDGLLAVAVPLLALTLTRNPLIIAGLTGANRASAAVAALPGGLVADRWDRRNVMVACNVVAGVTLLALVGALTIGSGELVMLYIVATVLAACDVTYTLAVQASLPDVISQDRLAVANGRLIAVEGAGEQLIGPAIGGVLFSLARRVPFFADGISFFVSASLVAIGLPRRARPGLRPAGHGAETSNGARPHARATEQITTPAGTRGPEEGGLRRTADRSRWTVDFRQGLSVFRSDRALKLLAAVAAAGALCQTMVLAILVLYGEQTLHLTSTGYGLFLAFAAAIGVGGAHFAGYLQERWGSGQLILGGLTLAAVSYIGLAFTHSVVPAVFVFGLQEIGTVAANVGSVTARQHIIPRRLYGRVGSVHRLAVLSASVVGALLGGFITSASSVEATMLVAGASCVVTMALFAPWLLRALAPAGHR